MTAVIAWTLLSVVLGEVTELPLSANSTTNRDENARCSADEVFDGIRCVKSSPEVNSASGNNSSAQENSNKSNNTATGSVQQILCANGYAWNGIQCANVATPPLCPGGYHWNGHSCITQTVIEKTVVSSVTMDPNCQPPTPPPPVTTECFEWQQNCAQTSSSNDGTQMLQKPKIVFSRPPHVLTTEKPISQPPEKKCLDDYQWNGSECVKNVSIPAECPPNYVLVDDQCQHQIKGSCPPEFRLINSQCVGDSTYRVECPPTYEWNGEFCVHSQTACPPGYNLTANNQCERAIAGYCPLGTRLENDKCVQHHVANVECPSGYAWNGNECIQYTSVCGAGYHLVDNKCEKILIASPVPSENCADGFVFIDGECVSKIRKCPEGYKLKDDLCVEIAPTCPDGYEYNSHDSTCIQLVPAVDLTRPSCPPEFSLHGINCVHTSHADHIIKPVCPNDYILHGTQCITVTNRPGYSDPFCPPGYAYDRARIICVAENIIIRPSVLAPSCLEGYILVNGVCVVKDYPGPATEIAPPQCPNGYVFNGKVCVRHVNIVNPVHPPYGPVTHPFPRPACPFGFVWSNNQCTQIKPLCPEGFIYYNNACYLKPRPHQPPIVESTTEYLERNVSFVPPKSEHRPTNTAGEIIITNVIHNNNSIHNPINIMTNNSNRFEVHIYRGPNGGQTITATSCSDDLHLIRNNDTSSDSSGSRNCSNGAITIQIDSTTESHPHQLANANIDSAEESGAPCCDIVSPRKCKRVSTKTGDEWRCYHRKYHRCARYCTQPKIFLKPRRVMYVEPILIMPPPPARFVKMMSYPSNRLSDIGLLELNY